MPRHAVRVEGEQVTGTYGVDHAQDLLGKVRQERSGELTVRVRPQTDVADTEGRAGGRELPRADHAEIPCTPCTVEASPEAQDGDRDPALD